MQTFFSSLETLEAFTHLLNSPSSMPTCNCCLQNNQWVSHGYVYKQSSIDNRQIVGKRILCSRRYGKQGCGHSLQLYLQNVVPQRHCPLLTLISFVLALLQGHTVERAYSGARGNYDKDTRHGWRWLNALYRQLGAIRSCWPQRISCESAGQPRRSRRVNILLTSMQALLLRLPDLSCIQPHLSQRFF